MQAALIDMKKHFLVRLLMACLFCVAAAVIIAMAIQWLKLGGS